jgi:hypothetical protein
MPAPLDLTGQRFGKLVALNVVGSSRHGRKWLCQCDCGRDAIVQAGNLGRGNSTACGRCRVPGPTTFTAKHGHSTNGYTSPTYISWRAMKSRCTNEKRENAQYYVDRGITYDPQWEDFEAFLADMGERPDGLTLDRINNDLGYSKANCRWATPLEQRHNRRDPCLCL